MTCDAIVFLEFTESNQGKVTFGDRKYGKIIGIEKVDKNCSNSIENVYLANGLKFHLLSISQLCDKGNKVTFNYIECNVFTLETGKITLYGFEVKIFLCY